MPRVAKDVKVDAPGEIDKLRAWLTVRSGPRFHAFAFARAVRLLTPRARCRRHALPARLARQANYNGRDLPEAEKWRALSRLRTGGTKTAGVVDIFYMTHDEPPKCAALRVLFARVLCACSALRREGRGRCAVQLRLCALFFASHLRPKPCGSSCVVV
jgi:hypothetical protein